MTVGIKDEIRRILKGAKLPPSEAEKLAVRIEKSLHRVYGQGYYDGAMAGLSVERQLALEAMLEQRGVKP